MIQRLAFRTKISLWVFLIITFFYSASNAREGEVLFKENCVACHKMGSRLVGPDLSGINEKRSKEWLIDFIRSSQTMISNGDKEAIAIYDEYNGIAMPDHKHLDEEQINSILGYIAESDMQAGNNEATAAKETQSNSFQDTIDFNARDIEAGQQLFTGNAPLTNNGPSCLSCHNVNHEKIINGGRLARDLTDSYRRLGQAGLNGILMSPPFPAMSQAYKSKDLTEEEIMQLTAFLYFADKTSPDPTLTSSYNLLLVGGGSGMIILMLIISLVWNKRKAGAVNRAIFMRQGKTI